MRKLQLDENLLRKLHSEDVPLHEIAKQLNCHRRTIDKRVKELHLPKRRTGPKSGEHHPGWNGGVTIRKGYRLLYAPQHPNAINGRYVSEHRLVMERKLGRYLERTEVVHHMDGNKLNNSEENLVLIPNQSEHMKQEWLTQDDERWMTAILEGTDRYWSNLRSSESGVPEDTPPNGHQMRLT